MHDAAPAFDTFVIDDPDEPAALPPPPAIGRVATAELTMQVHVRGQWHRRTPDLKETACGVTYHTEFCRTRREVLTLTDGDMCESCFTPHELLRAMQADADAANAADEDAKKREAADAERKAKRWRTPTPTGDR